MSANPPTAANPTPPNRKVVGTMTMPLKCVLTPHQLEKKQAALLECHRKLSSHETHEANVKAQLKRDRTAIESEMKATVGVLNAGYEMRDIEVEKVADYDAGLVRHLRTDTGEEVDVERMSEALRQQDLDLRVKAAEDAQRPTNPDDVQGDDDPWGAPSDGRAPIAELPPPDGDVIDAEFVEGDGGDGDGGIDEDAEGDSGDDEEDIEAQFAGGREESPAPAPETKGEQSSFDALLAKKAAWLPTIARPDAEEHLNSEDVEDVRALFTFVCKEPAGRAQKRTLIPKILDALFKDAPF